MTLAGVVLAAGEGTRLRPLTTLLPKALCPVGNVPLVDLGLSRLEPHVSSLAVNAFHSVSAFVDHLSVHVSDETSYGEALGTAGALGALRDWIDGRPVLVTNADSYLPGGVEALVSGWDGVRCRLLVTPSTGRGDFVVDGRPVTYVGACLLPWSLVSLLRAEPSGLYEVMWRDSPLDFAVSEDVAIDCGTASDYLAANMHASGGANVIGAGSRVLGTVERSVVWPGSFVGPDEHLVDVVRAGPYTVG